MKMEELPEIAISIQDVLTCPICSKFAASPVYSCESGHVLCAICYDKTKTCGALAGQCQKPVIHNALIDLIFTSKNLKVSCRNVEWGCNLKIKPSDMKSHLGNCEFVPIICSEFHPTICEKKAYPPNQLFLHWRDWHKAWKLLVTHNPNKTISSVSQTLALAKDKLSSINTRWPVHYFEIGSETFFYHVEKSDATIYSWITSLSTETTANSYKFNLTISDSLQPDNNRRLRVKWTNIRVHSVQHYLLDKIKATGDYGIIPTSMVTQFQDNQDGRGHSFLVKADVSKF